MNDTEFTLKLTESQAWSICEYISATPEHLTTEQDRRIRDTLISQGDEISLSEFSFILNGCDGKYAYEKFSTLKLHNNTKPIWYVEWDYQLDTIAATDVLVLSKELGRALGITKSIVLSRIAHWIRTNAKDRFKKDTHFHGDMWWMYNTLSDWEKDIEVLSQPAIKQNIRELEELRLLYSTSVFNKFAPDRTKWYTINIRAFNAFMWLWKENNMPRHNGTGSQSRKYKVFIVNWKKEFVPQCVKYDEFWGKGYRLPKP